MTTVADHPTLKLGVSQPSPWDTKRLTLLTPKIAKTLPAPPASIGKARADLMDAIRWGVMANDEIGDCTVASEWHIVQAATTYEKKPFILPDDLVRAEYFNLSGGADTGLYLLQVLKPWRDRAVHGIAAYAEVPWTRADLSAAQGRRLLKLGVWLGAGAYAAANLPVGLQRNPYDWRNVGTGPDWRAGTWGGHAFPILTYRSVSGVLTFYVVTWGRFVPVSEAFLRAYADEVWLPVPNDWLNAKGKTPSGRTLQATVDAATALSA